MIDLYDVRYEDATDGDLYAISIVDEAANGFKFIALSKEKELVRMASEKKKILTGVVLVPNQKIYRKFDDGQEFNLTFNEQTILRLSQDFLIKGYQKNSTYNHSDKFLNGISTVESWIVEDPAKDKSLLYGFQPVKGTWMTMYKIENQNIWDEYVKSGKVRGFSIEGFLSEKLLK